MARFIDTCCQAARRGGQVLLEMASPRSVRAKSRRDLVTEADLAAQRAIFECIRDSYPDHRLLGEESDPPSAAGPIVDPAQPYLWAVDPLDGTTNFVHKIPYWCVSVALLHDGQPIAGAIVDPLRDECFAAEAGGGSTLNGLEIRTSPTSEISQALIACSFSAEVARDSVEVARFLDLLSFARAIRRMGSTALNLAYVAAGRLDGFFTSRTNVWDVAAGGLIVREAGGDICSPQGGRWQPLADPCILAASTEALRRDIRRYWHSAE